MATTLNEPSKLGYIDSLRGLAILMVILVHVGDVIPDLSPYAAALSNYGQFGVQLFFVVSAFTLCLSMERRRKEERPITSYFLRRYFRIAPLYYLGIVLYLSFSSFMPVLQGEDPRYAPWYTTQNVLYNLFLVHDFVPGKANNAIVPGGWSIGTETTFYLVFPLLFWFYKKIRNSEALLILVPVTGLIFSFTSTQFLRYLFHAMDKPYLWQSVQKGDFLYYNILCQLPVFLIGMSLYFLLQKNKETEKVTLFGSAFSFIGFSFIAVCLLVYFESFIHLLPVAAGMSFIFLFILYKELPLLSNKYLNRVGQLSFSIYLFHFLFARTGTGYLYRLLHQHVPADLILLLGSVLTLVLTTGLALLSERFIEKPGIELGRRIIERVNTGGRAMKTA